MCEKFSRKKLLCWNIFAAWGCHENILPRIFIHVWNITLGYGGLHKGSLRSRVHLSFPAHLFHVHILDWLYRVSLTVRFIFFQKRLVCCSHTVLRSIPPNSGSISGAVAMVCTTFLPSLNISEAVCTCCFAWAIAAASTSDEREPFGSGKPSLCCKYCRRAILAALTACIIVIITHSYFSTCYLFVVKNISWEIFVGWANHKNISTTKISWITVYSKDHSNNVKLPKAPSRLPRRHFLGISPSHTFFVTLLLFICSNLCFQFCCHLFTQSKTLLI